MRIARTGILALAAALIGCGGSLPGTGGPGAGGATGGTSGPPPLVCAALGACECMSASDRCAARTEACWCPSECNPNIRCICGGGQFLACEDKVVATDCDTALARVQTLCAGMAFVSSIGGICNQVNPTCIAGCLDQLATVQSCSQIDCSFCETCDCAGPVTPSAFRTCVTGCS